MLNFLKSGGWLIPVVLLVAGWARSEINAAEERGQAVLMAEQADSTWQALLDSLDGTWAEREATWDSTRAALSTELEDQKGVARVAREGAAQVVLAARSRIRTLHDSIETLTVEDLATIAAGIDSLEAAEAACNTALGTCEELLKVSDLRLFDVTNQFDQSVGLNRQQALTIDRLRDVRKPSIGTVGWAGWLTAAVAIVVAVVK